MDARPLLCVALGLLAFVLVAGCTGDEPRTSAVNATFEENASATQLSDLMDRLLRWGPNLTVAASEPLRVVISDLTAGDCQEVRDLLHELDYIVDVGTCRTVAAGQAAGNPASS